MVCSFHKLIIMDHDINEGNIRVCFDITLRQAEWNQWHFETRNSEKSHFIAPPVLFLGQRSKKIMKLLLSLAAVSTTGDN